MKNTSRCVLLACIGLAACGNKGAPAAGAAQRPQLAFITNGVFDFWRIAAAGCAAAGREFDADAEVLMPTSPALTNQKQMLQNVLARGVDGVAISPIDPANQREMIDDACARTTLITHDSDAPDSKRLCYIGIDNYDAGRQCGQLVKEALPDGGSILIFVGRLEQDNARLRRQGLIDELIGRSPDKTRYDKPGTELVGGGYTILDTRTDSGDEARAKQNAEDAIATYPDLDCMVGLFQYNTPACLEAVRGAGKLERIKLVAFDEHDQTLQGIKDGAVSGTVVQNPYEYGFQSVRILAALLRGDRAVIPDGGFLNVPARQIRKDNVQAYWDDLKQKLAAGAIGK
jgi:ribose transport system substrate-binding protein